MALARQLLKNSMLGLWVVDNMKYTQTFAEAYRQVRLKQELSEDHEVSMAVSQLKTIQDNVNQLMSALQTKGSDYELEAWVQSKITSANDKMTSAADYMKNSPSVSEDFDDMNRQGGSKHVAKKDNSKDEVQSLKDQIQMLKIELENEVGHILSEEDGGTQTSERFYIVQMDSEPETPIRMEADERIGLEDRTVFNDSYSTISIVQELSLIHI